MEMLCEFNGRGRKKLMRKMKKKMEFGNTIMQNYDMALIFLDRNNIFVFSTPFLH